MTSAGDDFGVSLSAAIGTVRSELEKAIDEGKNSTVGFVPGALELEFELGFAHTGGADAGVRLWVVSVVAKSEENKSGSHHLKVVLTPSRRDATEDKTISSTGDK